MRPTFIFLFFIVLLTIGCSKQDSATAHDDSDFSDPDVAAWYKQYLATYEKTNLSPEERQNVRKSAPAMLFSQNPELAGEEFNRKIQLAKTRAAATKEYWSAVYYFSELRKGLPAGVREVLLMHVQQGRLTQLQADFMISIARFCTLQQEIKAVRSLDLANVDQRAIGWTADYLAWVQRRAGFELQSTPDLSTSSQVPAAVAESLFRMGLGDPQFMAPLDEQRRIESQRTFETTEKNASFGTLDGVAAELNSRCMQVRAALCNDYGLDFTSIVVE